MRERIMRWVEGLRTKAPEERGEIGVLTGYEAAALAEELLGSERFALPEAVGAAMAGLRATAWLDGPELAGAHELLAWAAGRSLPLVVHVVCRGGPGHAVACGTGHDAWHAVADAGCVQLMAHNVQDVADLSIAAREIAETSLLPVLVGMDADQTAAAPQTLRLPDQALLAGFSGSPDTRIECPTRAQSVLFGDDRRRVPLWHDLERPALHGAAQGRKSWALGAAARQPYLHWPVPGLVARAFAGLGERTGRHLGALSWAGDDNAETVIVSQGSAVEVAEGVLGGRKLGVIGVRCLRPFPATELHTRLGGRTVLVMERVAGDLASEPPLLREVAPHARGRVVSLVGGAGGFPLSAADVLGACLSPPLSSRVYLGLDFAPADSAYPRQQAHFEELRQRFPKAAGLGLRSQTSLTPQGLVVALPEELVGPAAQLMQRLVGGHVRSRRRWLYWAPAPNGDPGDKVRAELDLDGSPAAVLGGLAGWLRTQGLEWKERDARTVWRELYGDDGLEDFESAWDGGPPARTQRPELPGRLPPLVVRELGDDAAPDGVRRFWGSVGKPFVEGAPLTPDPALALGAIPPLTSTFHDLSATRESLPAFAPDACTGCGDCWVACPEAAIGVVAIDSRALVDVAVKAGGSPLKPLAKKLAKAVRKQVRPDAGTTLREAGVAAPEEAIEAGAAALDGLPLSAPWSEDILLSLVVDPATCTACGACAAACEPVALTMQPQTTERVVAARRAWSVWEGLPDTAGPTMETLEPRLGPLAARLLTRHCAFALAGGNGRAPGSGAKLALRAALAMAEAALQPRLVDHVRRLRAVRAALGAAVRDELARALPSGATLEQALAEGDVSTDGALTPKDRARLRVRAALCEDLDRLRQRLEKGSRGLGRARFGLVLAPELAADWGIEFPYNPFQVPVVVAGAGRAMELAEGLAKGQLAQVDEGDEHLRAACRELKQEPPACHPPPVVVVGGDELLRANLGELPLKVLILCDHQDPAELELLALWRRGALVAQTAVGHPDHLAEVLLEALAHDGPAVVRIHAPTPADSSSAIPTSAEVVAMGRWPLWRLAPGAPLAELRLESETDGVLSELRALPGLRQELEAQYAAREAELRSELEEDRAELKADEDQRFADRLEGRLMSLAGILEGVEQ